MKKSVSDELARIEVEQRYGEKPKDFYYGGDFAIPLVVGFLLGQVFYLFFVAIDQLDKSFSLNSNDYEKISFYGSIFFILIGFGRYFYLNYLYNRRQKLYFKTAREIYQEREKSGLSDYEAD